MSTVAEKRHMDRIAAMPCVCCRLLSMQSSSAVEVHHIRQDREARNDFLTLPLCGDGCHRGPMGVHGSKTYLRLLKMSEWGLLAVVMADLQVPA